LAARLQSENAMTVGQKSVVADALQPGGQGVLQEEPDELLGG
jgi:hypothetical protein